MPSRRAGGLLIALLLSTTLTVFVIPPVYGSSGNPTLGVTNAEATQPTTFTPASSFVTVTAGSDSATTDTSVSGYFAIEFGTFGGPQLVTFSGTQFTLYFSKDGLSQISPGDIEYSGPTPFNVADLMSNTWRAVSETNGTFYIGQTTSGVEAVVGPVPLAASPAYKYVKIFDGSSTALAAARETVKLLPAMAVTPTSGPAGDVVTVTAGGFPANTLIDLAYSFNFYPWNGPTSVGSGNWVTSLSTGSGSFVYSAPMVDAKQSYNPSSGLRPNTHVTIDAVDHGTPTVIASAGFVEENRVVTGVKSYNSAGGIIDGSNAPPGPYGNDTSSAGSNLVQPVNANVLGTIGITGNYWMANTAVTFTVGGVQVESAGTNGTGYFDATISVPQLAGGERTVQVVNDGVAYEFNVTILPTMTVSPASGPVGGQLVVQAHGFTANTMWYIYWHEKSIGDATWFQVAHGTTGADGSFNETVAFRAPQAFGGAHAISASSTNVSSSEPNSPVPTVAMATTTVSGTTTTTTTSTSTTSTSTTKTTTSSSSASTTTTRSTSQTTTGTQTTTTSPTAGPPELNYAYELLIGAVVVLAALVIVLARRGKAKTPAATNAQPSAR
jgi:hypothetical protein